MYSPLCKHNFNVTLQSYVIIFLAKNFKSTIAGTNLDIMNLMAWDHIST